MNACLLLASSVTEKVVPPAGIPSTPAVLVRTLGGREKKSGIADTVSVCSEQTVGNKKINDMIVVILGSEVCLLS